MNILLSVKGNGPYVFAPEFCPYKEVDIVDKSTVHSNICLLCKICNFCSSEVISREHLSEEEIKGLIDYIERESTKLTKSAIGQINHLASRGRLPLAIFISAGVFEQALIHCKFSLLRRQNLINFYTGTSTKLGKVFGLPTFIHGKLTNSPIMVIGEITWK